MESAAHTLIIMDRSRNLTGLQMLVGMGLLVLLQRNTDPQVKLVLAT